MTDITPHVDDVFNVNTCIDLDPATVPTRDLFLAALDRQIDALAVVPVTSTRPDPVTTEIVGIGTAAMLATDDPIAADVLVRVLDHVADLDEQLQATRMLTSGALAVAHRHHRHIKADREARHAA